MLLGLVGKSVFLIIGHPWEIEMSLSILKLIEERLKEEEQCLIQLERWG